MLKSREMTNGTFIGTEVSVEEPFRFFRNSQFAPMGEFLQLHFKQVFCLATTFEGELSIGSESVCVCVCVCVRV